MSEIVWAVLFISISTTAAWFFYTRVVWPVFFTPLSKVPHAHPSVGISSFWINRIRSTGYANETIHRIHEKYGPVVRLGPNEISINCVDEGVKKVYGSGFEKSNWYRKFDYFGKSTLMHSPNLHQNVIEVMLQRVTPILAEAANTESPLNVFDLYRASTLDFVSAFLFGPESGTNSLENRQERANIFRMYADESKAPIWRHPLLGFIAPSMNNSMDPGLFHLCMRMCESAKARLLSHIDSGSKGLVFHQLQEAGLNPIEMASELVDHFTAGHQTSSATLTFLSYQLSACPDVQEKLREEMRSILPMPMRTGDPSMASYLKSLDALPLLDAVVMETLRLYPPIAGPQPRITPNRPMPLGPFTLPPRTEISAQAFSLHRNPDVFPDPLHWVPERWLEKNRNDMRRWFWAFGSGGRMCIGSNFAMILYTQFRTVLVENEKPSPRDGYRGGPKREVLDLQFSCL
ncbi:predicted protein [Uncinocarpus reesii 1704]|uniref:Cytochrome P450 monooxygenase n=1 Tax=Uncinocarpus reesii (strain UAMH 1704) TaxID=336963 RepID=C4JXV4_UNCRE|nr:uncharacterized protein UREG_07892 [Uncinocarpus reesii 1704]EEP83027.1 predicted protein [Uncinocarpus reesii 1704]